MQVVFSSILGGIKLHMIHDERWGNVGAGNPQFCARQAPLWRVSGLSITKGHRPMACELTLNQYSWTLKLPTNKGCRPILLGCNNPFFVGLFCRNPGTEYRQLAPWDSLQNRGPAHLLLAVDEEVPHDGVKALVAANAQWHLAKSHHLQPTSPPGLGSWETTAGAAFFARIPGDLTKSNRGCLRPGR